MSAPPRTRSRTGRVAQQRGVGAENRVCRALEREGWTVLYRRVRTGCGEIDIVANLSGAALIAFIEVKARRRLGEAAGALTAAQRARLLAAAAILLGRHPEWSDCTLRFDLVVLDDAGHMHRLADAFRIGDDGD